jgi:hemerythrin
VDAGPGFQIGVPALEVGHRQIRRRSERIAADCAAGRVPDVRAGLAFLAHYLADHFAAEEQWMDEHGYPGWLEHARTHAGLVARITDARRTLELVGPTDAMRELLEVIVGHLDGDDQKLVRFRAARESLRRMADPVRSATGLDAAPAGAPASPHNKP